MPPRYPLGGLGCAEVITYRPKALRRFADPRTLFRDSLVLSLLAIGGYLQMVVAIWLLLYGMAPASAPHMILNALATPLAFLVALVWAGFRLTGHVGGDTAGGFGVCALGLAIRAQSELLAWIGDPPVAHVFGEDVPQQALVELGRHAGTIAYVAGLVFVVSASIVSARSSHVARFRSRPVAMLTLAVIVVLSVLMTVRLVSLWLPMLRP